MKGKLTLTTIAAAATAALALAPMANADDSGFQAQLNQAGLGVSGNPILAGNTARSICEGLADGMTPSVARYSATMEFPTFTDSQAATFVNLAIRNYCPNISR